MSKERGVYTYKLTKNQLAEAKYGTKAGGGAVDKGLGTWQTFNKLTFVGAGIGWLAVPALAPLWATSMAIDGAQNYVIGEFKKKKEKAVSQSKETVVFDSKKAKKSQYALAA